jgi:hypothetical protein
MRRITQKSRALVALATVLAASILAAALPLVAMAANGGGSGP